MARPANSAQNPLCVALDIGDRSELLAVARATAEHAGALKIGLGGFVAWGPDLVTVVAALRPVFLDLKLHDIPAQVEGAARTVGELGATYTTVHALGGADVVKAAVAGAGSDTAVLAVTILTSMDSPTLAAIGMEGSLEDAVVRLGHLALEEGADGLVCSPREVERLRKAFGPEPLLVTPGIRSSGAGDDDQKRTLDARSAVRAGADIIVVGRPVTRAPDPAAAAAALLEELRG